MGAMTELPAELDESLATIFGMMPWNTAHLAEVLRFSGIDVPRKCEMEQAHVMFWLVKLYMKYGPCGWRAVSADIIEAYQKSKEEKKADAWTNPTNSATV